MKRRCDVTLRLSDGEIAMVRAMLAAGCGRELVGKALNFADNYLPALMRNNGLGGVYRSAMASRQTARTGQAPAETEANGAGATRVASKTLAERLIQAGAPGPAAPRPERTFEEKLALVRAGKARLVPNVKIGRPEPLLTSNHGEAMS
jgi:hypothetical protein